MPNMFRNKIWRFFSQVSIEVLLSLFKLIFSLTPKLKNQWVIGHNHGFCDNAKLVAQEIAKNRKDIKLVWLKSDSGHNVDDNIISCSKYSLLGVYYQITSKVFIVSTGINDIGRLTPYFGCYYFNLWHGWPIKKIGLDSKETSPSTTNAINNLYKFLYRRSNQRYSAFFCHNSAQAKVFQQAFGVAENKTIVTGWPRLKEVKSCKFAQLTFAPTWHTDSKTTVNLIDSVVMEFERQSELEKLCVCLHPFDKGLITQLELKYKSNNITFNCGDTMENVKKSKVVISDFSSTVIDAMVTYNCEIILFHDNIKQYKNERGVYSEFYQIIESKVDLNKTVKKDFFNIQPSDSECTSKIIDHIISISR